MKALKINLVRATFLLAGLFLLPFFALAQSQVPEGNYPNVTDAGGKKQGAWKKLDAQGTCVYVGQFKDDKPYGVFKYFDTEGRIMTEMNFLNGGPVAYGKTFNISGKIQAEGKYVNQLKDSVWRFYNEEGIFISEERYVKGKKEGKSTSYYPGTQQVFEVKYYKNDLQDSVWVQYYVTGKKVAEGTYKMGHQEGKAVWYLEDGRINILGNYKNSAKHGTWVYYWIDEKGNYVEKGREVWENGVLKSGGVLIKKEDLYKTIEDPQNPDHNRGGEGGY